VDCFFDPKCFLEAKDRLVKRPGHVVGHTQAVEGRGDIVTGITKYSFLSVQRLQTKHDPLLSETLRAI
jgi:hypothetical protein